MKEMMLVWGVTYVIHSSILIVGALLTARRVRSPYVRDFLWKLALVGAVVTASIQLAIPSQNSLPLPQSPTREIVAAESSMSRIEGVVAVPGSPNPATAPTAVLPPANGRVVMASGASLGTILTAKHVQTALASLWLLGALFLLARLGVGHARLLRDLRGRHPVDSGENWEILQRLRESTSLRRPVRLSVSEETPSPLALLGAEIVIPGAVFRRLSTAQRESILAHELAHVRRHDPAWLTLSEILGTILFFQPLNRLVTRRLQETAEFICDDAAVRHTGDRKALAETLAEIAATLPPRWTVGVAGMAEGGSGLVRRVKRVLREGGVHHEPMKPGAKIAIVLVLLVSIAGVAPGIARPAEQASASAGEEGRHEAFRGEESEPGLAPGDHETAPPEPGVVPVRGAASPRTSEPRTAGVRGDRAATGDPGISRFEEGALTQSFDGPEGATNVRMTARHLEIASDGSLVRVLEEGGFLRVRQQAEAGPVREVEVTRTGGRQTQVYRVEGRERPWGAEARRVIAASFLGEKAWDGWRGSVDSDASHGDEETSRRSSRTPPAWDTHLIWRATIHDENEQDGVRHEIRLISRGVHYNPTTGEVFIEPDGRLAIEEVVGDRARSFTRTARGVEWSGDWRGEGASARQQWVRSRLTADSSLPASVIETLSRPD